jgi:uncharacterized protein (TIGR01777 family)
LRYVLTGGSGQIGTILARALHAAGEDVVVVSRSLRTAPWRIAGWDGFSLGKWTRELDGADVVINLAGRSVNCRYTERNMQDIMASRVNTTRLVGEAIARAQPPPRVWLQASTATIYAHRFDAPNDEHTGVIGGAEPDVPAYWKFSIDVATAWEQALADAYAPRTRRVAMRAAVVMSPDKGGALDLLLRLVRFGLGGRSASGRQYVSWVHDHDFVNAVRWLVVRDDLNGAVNITSPGPLPNDDFMRILRNAAGVRIGLPATTPMLKLGAVVMRSDVELMLKSRRVVPARLLDSGFQFEFPTWEDAARDLVGRWRSARR